MGLCFRQAKQEEVEIVYNMIASRVNWMNEKGIHQWNDTGYLSLYPLEYYKSNITNLYVLTDEASGRVLSAAIILQKDDRWNLEGTAYYIHNFVSVRNACGAGRTFIKKLQDLAERNGIEWMRLDSADDNSKLARYYTDLGFEACGTVHEGNYHGILRQKKIL